MSPRDVWSDTVRDSARQLVDAERAARHDAQSAPHADDWHPSDDLPDLEDVTFAAPAWRAGWRKERGIA